MKNILSMAMLILLSVATAQAQEEEVRIPSGYQGFIDQGTSLRFTDGWASTICVSTTHGFYFGDHTYVGIGVGLEGGDDYFGMPIYTAIKYNFSYRHQVTPAVQLRVGSFISEKVGTYGDMGFGFRFGSKRDFAINVLLVGTFYSNIEREVYSDGHYSYEDFNPSSVGLRIGIEW